MDDKEIIQLIKSNAILSANMEAINKELSRLINVLEKDVKGDIEVLDKRIDELEKKAAKFEGKYVIIAFLVSGIVMTLIRYIPNLLQLIGK